MIGILTDDEVEEVLQSNVFGRIGCQDNNKIYVVPVNYVYDGKYIIAHSVEGMKISETARPPEISEKRVHPRSPGNIRPVVYRIVISEKTGRFENETL